MKSPSLTFYGGVGATTGANIMLEFNQQKILIDCGLFQATGAGEKNFEKFKYDPKSVSFLIITHAHMDHIGRVPKLVREGFAGKIISTKATKELALPMLLDALKVMQARHPDKTLFDQKDIEKSFELWEGWDYRKESKLFEGCSLEMQDAGHILGSAICNVVCGEGDMARKFAFTGDLGNSPSPLLPDTEFPKDIDYLVIESVYGDRNHESKNERREKLKLYILDGIEKSGTIIIPAFSIERTQVILYEINNMIENKEIPQVPVFLDSPLAEVVTHIYQKYKNNFKESVKSEIKSGDDIFDFPGLRIVGKSSESKEIDKIDGAKIILAGSGMSEGGRVVEHEIHYLSDPKATVILVGYQPVGTLGRKLEDGAKEISPPNPPLKLRGFGRENLERSKGGSYSPGQKIKVRATIEKIEGYSSHKDSEHLLEFVEKTITPQPPSYLKRGEKKPKRVFVIMGEPKSSLFLTQRIRDYLDIPAVYPEEGKAYEL